MVRVGLLLLLLLSTASKAQDACYCTDQTNPTYGNCYANASCWACAPGAYNTDWQSRYCLGYTPPAPTCTPSSLSEERSCPVNFSGTQTWKKDTTCSNGTAVEGSWYLAADNCVALPPTCVASTESKSESCAVHFSGGKTYTRTSTCSDPYGTPVFGDWVLTTNTCTPDPHTCIVSVQTQSLPCEVGYVGTIIQDRTSTCPDPYGSPVWGSWISSSNTCVKSLTNATNPVSPVSPLNPVSPVASPVASPVQVVPSVTEPPSAAPSQEQSAEESTAESGAKGASNKEEKEKESKEEGGTGLKPGAKAPGIRIGGFGLALSLELFIKPGYTQQSLVSPIDYTMEISREYRRQQDFLIDLIANDDGYRALSGDQRARFGGLLWSNPLQQGYGGD